VKVKVGDTVYDGADEPVMAILSEKDKANIASMAKEHHRYCSFPPEMDREEVEAWMDKGWDAEGGEGGN
jgi:hypothetical protein